MRVIIKGTDKEEQITCRGCNSDIAYTSKDICDVPFDDGWMKGTAPGIYCPVCNAAIQIRYAPPRVYGI